MDARSLLKGVLGALTSRFPLMSESEHSALNCYACQDRTPAAIPAFDRSQSTHRGALQ